MDFLALLERLHKHQVSFVIIGGYASMILGSDLLTQDLDICIEITPENLERIYNAVEDINPRYRMHPRKLAMTREMATAPTIKNLYLLTDIGILDCLGTVTGLGDFNVVESYSRELDLSFGKIKTLYFDGLIKAKCALNREKDILTVKKLKAIQEKLQEKE